MKRNGFAMIAAMMLMSLLAIIAIAVLSLSAADRRRAVRATRTEVRENCAFSALTYARSYFGNKYGSWNTYLSTPSKYNPMNLPSTTTPAWSGTKTDLSAANILILRASNPELFLDLDNDGKADAYIFIRDNYDEFPPAAVNFQRDNDQNAIVGAICISSTMLPKRDDNTVDKDLLVMESMLAVNQQESNYSQGATTGNLNNNAAN